MSNLKHELKCMLVRTSANTCTQASTHCGLVKGQVLHSDFSHEHNHNYFIKTNSSATSIPYCNSIRYPIEIIYRLRNTLSFLQIAIGDTEKLLKLPWVDFQN